MSTGRNKCYNNNQSIVRKEGSARDASTNSGYSPRTCACESAVTATYRAPLETRVSVFPHSLLLTQKTTKRPSRGNNYVVQLGSGKSGALSVDSHRSGTETVEARADSVYRRRHTISGEVRVEAAPGDTPITD